MSWPVPEGCLEWIARPAAPDGAVVFLHGLDGHPTASWGADEAPGAFCHRLAADLPTAAVATFGYPAELLRILGDPELTLERLVEIWARVLAETLLPGHRRLAVVGHCLGGLVTTMALRLLATEGGVSLTGDGRRLAVFLLDTIHIFPREEEIPPGFMSLQRKLRLEGPAFRANIDFWQRATQPERFAVTSADGGLVAPFRPDAGLPSDRHRRTALSHEELTRAPAEGPFETYEAVWGWLRPWWAAGPATG